MHSHLHTIATTTINNDRVIAPASETSRNERGSVGVRKKNSNETGSVQQTIIKAKSGREPE
jgi:hypothetical protein